MEYALRGGKRYYRDENGRWVEDKITQEQADRMVSRNIRSTPEPRQRIANRHYGSPCVGAAAAASSRSIIPWGGIIFICIVLTLILALLYNQLHESPSQQAISEYMDWYNSRFVETAPEEAPQTSVYGLAAADVLSMNL